MNDEFAANINAIRELVTNSNPSGMYLPQPTKQQHSHVKNGPKNKTSTSTSNNTKKNAERFGKWDIDRTDRVARPKSAPLLKTAPRLPAHVSAGKALDMAMDSNLVNADKKIKRPRGRPPTTTPLPPHQQATPRANSSNNRSDGFQIVTRSKSKSRSHGFGPLIPGNNGQGHKETDDLILSNRFEPLEESNRAKRRREKSISPTIFNNYNPQEGPSDRRNLSQSPLKFPTIKMPPLKQNAPGSLPKTDQQIIKSLTLVQNVEQPNQNVSKSTSESLPVDVSTDLLNRQLGNKLINKSLQ